MYDTWFAKVRWCSKVFCSDLRKVIYVVSDTGNQRISNKRGIVKVSKVFFI